MRTKDEVEEKIHWLNSLESKYAREGRLDQLSFIVTHRAVLHWVLGDSLTEENEI